LASRANAYYPTDPPATATEPSAHAPEPGGGMEQTRVDAASLVVEIPVPVLVPAAVPAAPTSAPMSLV